MRYWLWLAALLPLTAHATDQDANKTMHALSVVALHQIDDEARAGFDFFSSEYAHECGGKPSNRFRSYSRYDVVAERKFQLVLSALEHGSLLSVEALSCEGNAMRVGRIGVRKNK